MREEPTVLLPYGTHLIAFFHSATPLLLSFSVFPAPSVCDSDEGVCCCQNTCLTNLMNLVDRRIPPVSGEFSFVFCLIIHLFSKVRFSTSCFTFLDNLWTCTWP